MITFTVFGKAETAGSKRAFALRKKGGEIVTRPGGAPVISVTDDNPKSAGWKQEVAKAAVLARAEHGFSGSHLLDGPLEAEFTFYRPRPKGHFRGGRGRDDGSERGAMLSKVGRETPYPTSKPDVLKLARAVEDALKGVLYVDDSLIVREKIQKFWGEPARVVITVMPL